MHTNTRFALSTVLLAIVLMMGQCTLPAQPPLAPGQEPVTDPTPGPTPGPTPAPVELSDDARAYVGANTAFGFDVLAGLLEEDAGENIFISPLSIAMALAMTYNGAAGETQQAMAETLHLGDLSLDDINQANAELRQSREQFDEAIELIVANSLWAREGFGFKDDFLARNESYFGAEIAELDFNDPAAADIINQWVEAMTQGKIEDIVEPPIDPLTVLFLINAVYFKGQWQEPFDEELTEERTFHLPDGREKEVPMMQQRGDYRYLETDDFQAVSLPYGAHGRMSMYIFLPRPDSDLELFLQQLTADNWDDWMHQFREIEGTVMLPRFQVEYEASLKDSLKALGMEIAFDESQADFSGMRDIPPRLYIEDVRHKTFVEVNEEGTEAAAVTAVEVRVESAPLETFNFIADRPFFYAIRDNETEAILFMGALVDPQPEP